MELELGLSSHSVMHDTHTTPPLSPSNQTAGTRLFRPACRIPTRINYSRAARPIGFCSGGCAKAVALRRVRNRPRLPDALGLSIPSACSTRPLSPPVTQPTHHHTRGGLVGGIPCGMSCTSAPRRANRAKI
jgi:hypothetical protein